MTLICSHRVNEPAALRALPKDLGVEIDLRSQGDRLILEHDAFLPGPDFEEWLDHYDHRFIVVNTKEEGLEVRIEELLEQRGVNDWAYLDQSFPFMVKTLRRGQTRTMVRVSEYESIETAASLDPRPDWVWLDSFGGTWPDAEQLARIGALGYRIMIVSPELQARSLDDELDTITDRFVEAGMSIDGICTKRPDAWHRPEAPWWVR